MSEPQSFRFQSAPLTAEEISAFRQATRTENGKGLPLTFPTRYRRAEFQWLDEMKVDMRSLLHTEQAYQYHAELKVGDVLTVETRRTQCRERRGMMFVTLETDIRSGGELKISSETQFVIRSGGNK